jgi:hypothetical protein
MGAEADASWSVDSFYNRFEQQYVFVSPDDSTVIVRMGRNEVTDWPSLLSDLSTRIAAGNSTGG